jgi:hypothetical protein
LRLFIRCRGCGAQRGEEIVDGDDWRWFGFVVFGCVGQAQEMAMDAEPSLLEDDLVALELAIGLVGGELFVDGDFGEAGGFEASLHLRGDATNAGELALGVREFSREKFFRGHPGVAPSFLARGFHRDPRVAGRPAKTNFRLVDVGGENSLDLLRFRGFFVVCEGL